MLGSRKKERQNRWEGVNVLDLVPQRLIAHESGDDGLLNLLDPRFKGRLLGWLQPRLPAGRAYVKVRLDAQGSIIWQALDGESTVSDVVRGFVARNPEDAEQAAERVWRFLTAMEHHGFISLSLRP